MWLLKVSDRGPTLVSISDDELEPDITGIARTKYAIVSHRWEADDEEVTFDEMRALSQPLTKEQSLRSPFTKEHSLGPLRQPFMKGHSLGYRKIRECCELARARGYQYLWIDTCCIDKRSSAELSEAINSMFHWYERASVCFVYLKDTNMDSLESNLAADQWFRRGWTLQELLAPRHVEFFDTTWRRIGTKNSLVATLKEVTGIDSEILIGEKSLFDCSIAERMSWAWNRKTSRVEDTAYCLLGIFDVNMPLLYGERGKAFIRLQEEIIRKSTDESIFAWHDSQVGFDKYREDILADNRWENVRSCHQAAAAYVQEQVISHSTIAEVPGAAREEQPHFTSTMLARNPMAFRYANDINVTESSVRRLQSFTLTNRGLTTMTSLRHWSPNTYILPLNCHHRESKYNINILLRCLPGESQYARVQVAGEQLIDDARCAFENPPPRCLDVVYVPQILPTYITSRLQDHVYGFHIDIPGLKIVPQNSTKCRGQWNEMARIAFLNPGDPCQGLVCDLYLDSLNAKIKTIKIGYDRNFVPFFVLGKVASFMVDNWEMRDKKNHSRLVKSVNEPSQVSPRESRWFAYAVGGGGWILDAHDFKDLDHQRSGSDSPRDIFLIDFSITKTPLAKVSLEPQFLHNNYKTQDWSIRTLSIDFSIAASFDTGESEDGGPNRFDNGQVASSGRRPSSIDGTVEPERTKPGGLSRRLATLLGPKW